MHIGGFTVSNPKHPHKGHVIEDAFVARHLKDRIILAVADGVTRDPLPVLPDKSTKQGAALWRKHYPNPSPAYEVARLACDTFLDNLLPPPIDGFRLSETRAFINNRIGSYNREHFPHPNFLVNDEVGCQFAYAAGDANRLFFGALSSSGVALLDTKGNLLLKTPDTYWSTDNDRHAFLKNAGLEFFASGRGIWEKPETRHILRSTFRNKKIHGGYGILTGDETALRFFLFNEVPSLKHGESALVYTDGMAELLFQNPFKQRTSLRKEVKPFFTSRDFKGLEQHCQKHVTSEGTLAYVVQ